MGSYALTELKLARARWRRPKDRVLPVLLQGVQWDAVPPYLKAVRILEPEGNVPGEVLSAVAAIASRTDDPEEAIKRTRKRLASGALLVTLQN
jgi:hypothetical protein